MPNNIGQQETNFYNGNYPREYNPLNYGAYNPNPQVAYNPNFPGSFKPNHLGAYNGYPPQNDSTEPFEIKFTGLAEASFKKYFNFEKIIRDVNDFFVSLEKTYKLLTQSFSTGSTIMKNGDQYVTIFNYIWKSLKLYKLFRWLYVKFLNLLGCHVPLRLEDDKIDPTAQSTEVSYGVLAFLGVIFSAPYFISHLFESIPEDAIDPIHWRHSGYLVKVIQDFVANTPNEISVRINDKLIVAPKLIQSKMDLYNSEFVFATDYNGYSGLVPVNHLMMEQPEQTQTTEVKDTTGNLKDQVD